MKKDVQVGIRMPSDLRDKLKELAEAERRDLANYIRLVLEQHLASKKGKR